MNITRPGTYFPSAPLLAALLVFAACQQEKHAAVPAGPPARIVSLSPSITREIVDLGSGGRLVGVTSYDDLRESGITVVGTLVQPNLEAIVVLEPDIVLYSAEDGLVQNIDRISAAGIAVYGFGRNRNFEDICGNYHALAGMLGRTDEAVRNVGRYRDMLGRLKKTGGTAGRPLVVFLVSCRPLIAASADSFIGHMVHDAGGRCAYDGGGRPHPPVSLESLVAADPDVIIAMTGGDDTADFFRQLSREFRDLKSVSRGRLHDIPPDTVPYYTPADYVRSVGRISRILGAPMDAPKASPGTGAGTQKKP